MPDANEENCRSARSTRSRTVARRRLASLRTAARFSVTFTRRETAAECVEARCDAGLALPHVRGAALAAARLAFARVEAADVCIDELACLRRTLAGVMRSAQQSACRSVVFREWAGLASGEALLERVARSEALGDRCVGAHAARRRTTIGARRLFRQRDLNGFLAGFLRLRGHVGLRGGLSFALALVDLARRRRLATDGEHHRREPTPPRLKHR